jgi:hypothetical protein
VFDVQVARQTSSELVEHRRTKGRTTTARVRGGWVARDLRGWLVRAGRWDVEVTAQAGLQLVQQFGACPSLKQASSITTCAEITSRVIPLPAADRISARFHPNVHAPAAGRAARRIAHSDAPIAPTSESMWPASDSGANDPDTTATTTSATMNSPSRASATTR